MYNNTKKSYRKIYRKKDKDGAYSEEFLLISTGIVVDGFFSSENLHFSDLIIR